VQAGLRERDEAPLVRDGLRGQVVPPGLVALPVQAVLRAQVEPRALAAPLAPVALPVRVAQREVQAGLRVQGVEQEPRAVPPAQDDSLAQAVPPEQDAPPASGGRPAQQAAVRVRAVAPVQVCQPQAQAAEAPASGAHSQGQVCFQGRVPAVALHAEQPISPVPAQAAQPEHCNSYAGVAPQRPPRAVHG
jgi:hypothetical protein